MIKQSTLAVSVVAVAGAASANVTGNLIEIRTIVDGGESFSWSIGLEDDRVQRVGGTYSLDLSNVDVMNGSDIVFSIDSLSVLIDGDAGLSRGGASGERRVNVGFDLVAGSQNSTFQVDSAFLSFAEIQNAFGAASAAVSVTDLNFDGATVSPVSGGMYLAQINGAVPGGTDAAQLLNSPLSVGVLGTDTVSENFGGGSFVALNSDVSSISSRFEFALSAGDLASGTGTFVVIPAPASAALLGLSCLVSVRRRR